MSFEQQNQHIKKENHAASEVISLVGRGSSTSKNDMNSRRRDPSIRSISLSTKDRIMEAGKRMSSEMSARESAHISLGPAPKKTKAYKDIKGNDNDINEKERALQEAPFYYYREHSQDADDDPLVPLTPPGKTPNFPAKMHAILSNPDIADIVEWLPHGRSWRITKPREFEHLVLPRYFEHSKFSSFVRQTNGWGFRRISVGSDRNSYYNELFLRGLPHLCKKMKRHGVSEKFSIDVKYEPDLGAISKLFPVPEETVQDDFNMLEATINEGPRARMPVRYDVLAKCSAPVPQEVRPKVKQDINLPTLKATPTPKKLDIKLPTLETTLTVPDLYNIKGPYRSDASVSSMDTEKTKRSFSSISTNSKKSSHFSKSTKSQSDADRLTSYFSIIAAQENVRQQQQIQKQKILQTQGLLSLLGSPTPRLLHAQNCQPSFNVPVTNTAPAFPQPMVQSRIHDMYNQASVASHLEAAASHIRSALSQAATIPNPPQLPQQQASRNSQSLPSIEPADAQSLASWLKFNGMK